MQEKFTSKRIIMGCLTLTSFIMMLSFSSNLFAQGPQGLCPNESILFLETFGSGTTPSSSPDVTSTIAYQDVGILNTDGVYRITNNTLINTGWHNSPDHTGNANGKMLVFNGAGSNFYRHVVNIPTGFQVGFYSVSFYFMNVNLPANCAAGANPPLSFLLEYQAQDNSWVALGGSTTLAPLMSSPTWIQMASIFVLPQTGSFTIQNMRITMNDGILNQCGNDFAIDDIKLTACTSGGPLPVDFANVSAKQKGTGVSVNWSTLTETNNKYFDIERSTDGGTNWGVIATNKTSGSSSVVRNYNAFDSKPIAGQNFYRIKQVDLDGKFKYSIVVSVKFNIDQTVASVLTNPFVNNISIDFSARRNQNVYVILMDAAGKTIVNERWGIVNGSSRKTLDKVSSIQKGIYILKIVDEEGGSIYSGKLVKQ